mmetsp:Transcript_19948/g.24643  ORF Transcript_19948/g.24643 Transcript_19948/m.24643 type:complete len:103 (-) Transcript_19948:160-468(-)
MRSSDGHQTHTHPHVQQIELNRTSKACKPTVADVMDYNNSGKAPGALTQARLYSQYKRSSTRASEAPSLRDNFFSSFNGPKLNSNETYQTAMSELTADRIVR